MVLPIYLDVDLVVSVLSALLGALRCWPFAVASRAQVIQRASEGS